MSWVRSVLGPKCLDTGQGPIVRSGERTGPGSEKAVNR